MLRLRNKSQKKGENFAEISISAFIYPTANFVLVLNDIVVNIPEFFS